MDRNFDAIKLPADRTAVLPQPPAAVLPQPPAAGLPDPPAIVSAPPAAAFPHSPAAISPETLVAIAAGLPVPVAPGRHPGPGDEACLMELASALAREPWSDHPACVHPVLAAVARAVSDRVGDAAREWLAPLVPRMIGTADAGPDGRPRPERCAQIVLLCARTALRLSPFMAAEMESARLTALSVLSRPAGSLGGPPGGTGGGAGAAQKNGTAVRRGATALLDRFGLLSRLYPRQAAVEAAQAVSIIAGAGPAATRQADTRRDAQLCELLRACTELCADDAPPPAPSRGAQIQATLPAGAIRPRPGVTSPGRPFPAA